MNTAKRAKVENMLRGSQGVGPSRVSYIAKKIGISRAEVEKIAKEAKCHDAQLLR